jgi:hypothetical protein
VRAAGFVIDIDKKEASESIGCLLFVSGFKIQDSRLKKLQT